MKKITLTIAILFVQLVAAQVTDYIQVAKQVTDVLEDSKTIQQLIQQQSQVRGQLDDINLWNSRGTISSEDYVILQISYTNYTAFMNSIVKNLEADLMEISKIRKLKDASLNRFIERFNSKYDSQLSTANTIYNTEFAPALSRVTIENGGKSGIIASILAIIEVGDILYSSLKKLFTTGKLDRDMEEQLVSLAMNTAINELDKKLKYPSWGEVITGGNQIIPGEERSLHFSNIVDMRFVQREYINTQPVYPSGHRSAGQYLHPTTSQIKTRDLTNNSTSNNLSLLHFQNNKPINLMPLTKGIIVGSEKNNGNIPLFETSEMLKEGDKFQVSMNGEYQASFFYYDEVNGSWNDPMGKGIIVGGNENNLSAVLLPSNNQYFEITKENEREHFLIVLSKGSINEKIKNQILNETSTEINLLQNLKEVHSSVSFLDNSLNLFNGSSISVNPDLLETSTIPVYILINKTKKTY